MNHGDPAPTPAFSKSRAGVTLIVALALGAFYLLAEHKAHVLGLLPYLLVLVCPLMHLFMHHGHHQHGDRHGPARSTNDGQHRQ